MKTELILLTPAQTAELAALNDSAPKNHRVPLVRGGVPARLLPHCGPGQTYEHFGNFLRGLAAEKNDDPKPIPPASEQKPKTRKK